MKKKKSAYVVDNVVENYEIIHSKCYVPPRATSDIYKNSFFVKTTQEWNSLDEKQVTCSSLDSFKASLQKHRMV